MLEILAFLENNNRYTNVDCLKIYHLPEGKDEITHIYAQKGDWSICVTAPHSGTGGRFLLRANPTATLDRWGTAVYETLLGSWEDVIRDLEYENYIYDTAEMQAEDEEF